jgi:antitoxin HicB
MLMALANGRRVAARRGDVMPALRNGADNPQVARMERSEIRDWCPRCSGGLVPDYTTLHPGYARRVTKRKNPHWGSTLDDFLREDGIREAARAEAATRVVAWQLAQEMERQGISKARLAELMHTSRAQVDRILKAQGNVTIATLQRATALVGRELRLELV